MSLLEIILEEDDGYVSVSNSEYIPFLETENWSRAAYKFEKNEDELSDEERFLVASIREFYGVQKIETPSQALIGYICVHKSKPEIKVIWSGTSNLAHVRADLTEGSPGARSFTDNKNRIFGQIVPSILNKMEDKLDISIYGHSLGGSLSQLTYEGLQEAIIKTPELQEKVGSMTLGVRNSSGVPNEVAIISNTNAGTINEFGISQRAYFIIAAGDPVQKAGAANILVGSALERGFCQVSLMKAHFPGVAEYNRTLRNLLWGMLVPGGSVPLRFGVYLGWLARNFKRAHTLRSFSGAEPATLGVELYDSSEQEQVSIIQQKLGPGNRSKPINWLLSMVNSNDYVSDSRANRLGASDNTHDI